MPKAYWIAHGRGSVLRPTQGTGDYQRAALELASIEQARPLQIALRRIGDFLFSFDEGQRRYLHSPRAREHGLALYVGYALGRIVEPFRHQQLAVSRPGISGAPAQTFLHERVGQESVPQTRRFQRRLVTLCGGEN